MRVKWLRQARQDLFAVQHFISQDSHDAAVRLIQEIRSAAMQLRKFPASGRSGRVSGTRELIVPGTPYIIVYRTHETTVEVLSVLHAARQWPEDFYE